MGRRRTSTASINERSMRPAVSAVNRRQTYHAATAANCVETIALHRRFTGPPHERAMKTTLTVKGEDHLVSCLTKFAHRGMPLTQNNLK